jgi:hypothetical protein
MHQQKRVWCFPPKRLLLSLFVIIDCSFPPVLCQVMSHLDVKKCDQVIHPKMARTEDLFLSLPQDLKILGEQQQKPPSSSLWQDNIATGIPKERLLNQDKLETLPNSHRACHCCRCKITKGTVCVGDADPNPMPGGGALLGACCYKAVDAPC